jgi:4-carboxymuconolactone decarboxylase
LKAGVPPEAAEAIRAGRDPVLEDPDDAVVHLFSRELLETRQVSDATYAAAVDRLGLARVVDLVGVLGYYTLISMTINAFHVPVPPGSPEPFSPL